MEKTTLPENWLRAGRVAAQMLPEKEPERVWMTATPTGSAVPVSDTKQPLITSCRDTETEKPAPKFRPWRELL